MSLTNDIVSFEQPGPGTGRVNLSEILIRLVRLGMYVCVCILYFQSARKKKKTKRKLLNTLLSYTILRLKEKVCAETLFMMGFSSLSVCILLITCRH